MVQLLQRMSSRRLSIWPVLASAVVVCVVAVIVFRTDSGATRSGLIAYVTEDLAVFVARADGSHPVKVGEGAGPVWAPDGSRLAFIKRTVVGGIQVVDPDGSHALSLETDGAIEQLRWAPDGRSIAYTCVGGRCTAGRGVYVVTLDGKPRRLVVALGDGPAWVSGGRAIAAHVDSELVITTLATGHRTAIPGLGADRPIASSPDGQLIAFTSNIRTDRLTSAIYVANADGSNVRKLAAQPDNLPVSLQWSPAGDKLLVAGNIVRILDATTGQSIDAATARRATQRDGGVVNPSWSPDGRSIAFVHAGKFTCVPDSDNCTTEYDAVVVSVGSARAEVIAHANPGSFSPDIAWQPRP